MMAISKNKRLVFLLFCVVAILSVPLIAMQFSSDVNWSLFDFVVAGALLTGTVLGIELILRRVQKVRHRIMLAMAVLVILFIIWLEIAVGVFGSPIAGS